MKVGHEEQGTYCRSEELSLRLKFFLVCVLSSSEVLFIYFFNLFIPADIHTYTLSLFVIYNMQCIRRNGIREKSNNACRVPPLIYIN